MANIPPQPGDYHQPSAQEQTGGGSGHYALRRHIPISPHAPQMMAHLAQQRKLAVDAAKATEDPPSLPASQPVEFGNGQVFDPSEYFDGLDVSKLVSDGDLSIPSDVEEEEDPFLTTPRFLAPRANLMGAGEPSTIPARQTSSSAVELLTPVRPPSTVPNPANLFTPPSPTPAHQIRPMAQPPAGPSNVPSKMGPVFDKIMDLMEFGPPGEMTGFPKLIKPAKSSNKVSTADEEAGEQDDVAPLDDDASAASLDGHISEKEVDDNEAPTASPVGRMSEKDRDIMKEGYARVSEIFSELASQTGRPISSIISHFNTSHGHASGRNYWNLYQAYFTANVERERQRARIPEGTAKQCWLSFQKHPKAKDLLATFEMAKMANAPSATIAQREKLHEKQFNIIKDYMSQAEQHKFESMYIQVGSCVNEDQGLGKVHCSVGLKGFCEYIGIPENILIGLAKTFSYSNVAGNYISEYVALRDTAEQEWRARGSGSTTKPDRPTSPGLDPKAESSKAKGEQERAEVRFRFLEAFEKVGYKTKNLPWTTLAKTLADEGIQIKNWPINVPFPCDDRKTGKASQGIKDLNVASARLMMAAFEDPETCPVFSKADARKLAKGEIPVIITAAPVFESKLAHGRRLFASGYNDYGGLPRQLHTARTRIKKKAVKAASPKPVEIISLSSTSMSPPSKRTRSHAQNKNRPTIVIDSDDEPLVSRIRISKKGATVNPRAKSSSSDSDDAGIHALRKDDQDFEVVTGDESETIANKGSTHKGKGVKGKAREKTGEKVPEKVAALSERPSRPSPQPRPMGPKAIPKITVPTIAVPQPRPQPRPVGQKAKMVGVIIPPHPHTTLPTAVAKPPALQNIPADSAVTDHPTNIPPSGSPKRRFIDTKDMDYVHSKAIAEVAKIMGGGGNAVKTDENRDRPTKKARVDESDMGPNLPQLSAGQASHEQSTNPEALAAVAPIPSRQPSVTSEAHVVAMVHEPSVAPSRPSSLTPEANITAAMVREASTAPSSRIPEAHVPVAMVRDALAAPSRQHSVNPEGDATATAPLRQPSVKPEAGLGVHVREASTAPSRQASMNPESQVAIQPSTNSEVHQGPVATPATSHLTNHGPQPGRPPLISPQETAYQSYAGPHYPGNLPEGERGGYGRYPGGYTYMRTHEPPYEHHRFDPRFEQYPEQYPDMRYHPYGERGYGFAYSNHQAPGYYTQRQGLPLPPYPGAAVERPPHPTVVGPARYPYAPPPNEVAGSDHPVPHPTGSGPMPMRYPFAPHPDAASGLHPHDPSGPEDQTHTATVPQTGVAGERPMGEDVDMMPPPA